MAIPTILAGQRQPAAGRPGDGGIGALCALAGAEPRSFIDNLDWEVSSDLTLIDAIDAGDGIADPFQSSGWLRAWLATIGAARKVRPAVVCGRFGGVALLVVPLAIEGRGPFARARFLAQDVSDYNEPLFHRELRPHVTAALMGALWQKAATLVAADFLTLGKVPLDAVEPSTGRRLRHCVEEFERSHWLAVDGPWQLSEDRFFGASSRNSLQRKEKKLAKFGRLAFRPLDAADARAAATARLVEWKAVQLAHLGAANRFRDPAFTGFLDRLARDGDPERYRLYALTAGKELLAVTLMICGARRWFLYQTAYHDGEAGRFSPGLLLLRHILRQAHEAGVDAFDFGLGNEGYKQRFCDRQVVLYRVSLPITLRGHVAVLAAGAVAWARDLVRARPALRRLALSVLRRLAPPRG
ncbi:MAG: hypothetical protein BroJett030_14980 [Alphaproteobacteria bacterium]|nr:MAG: hypothetical protein BroJett030_14980 [Alphaproteobacteria bacterium]